MHEVDRPRLITGKDIVIIADTLVSHDLHRTCVLRPFNSLRVVFPWNYRLVPSILGSCKIDSEDLSVIESRTNDVVAVVYILWFASVDIEEGGSGWAWKGESFQDDAVDIYGNT